MVLCIHIIDIYIDTNVVEDSYSHLSCSGLEYINSWSVKSMH